MTEVTAQIDIEKIWEADKFGRKEEAADLIAYLESLYAHPTKREDKQSFTLAVDAGYGEGKTFFLKRLTQQLALNHPVAYVDAWADDLADDPLAALVATLEEALSPHLKNKVIRTKFEKVKASAWEVTKIVGAGLIRRGAGLVITSQAANAIEAIAQGMSEEDSNELNERTSKIVDGASDDAAKVIESLTTPSMDARIAQFKAGQVAIAEMKANLAALVNALDENTASPPIVVVVDELDRCRPTYAIKLLEEIKHLFDVPGVIFILGMNAEQLQHSIKGAYGIDFDGRAYLSRFIDREYRLATPDFESFVAEILNNANLNSNQFHQFELYNQKFRYVRLDLPTKLSAYLQFFSVSARNAFKIVDILKISVALSINHKILLEYFLPIAIGKIHGVELSQISATEKLEFPWVISDYTRTEEIGRTYWTLIEFFQELDKTARYTDAIFSEKTKDRNPNYAEHLLFVTAQRFYPELNKEILLSYPELLNKVGRFTNPNHT